MLRALPIATWLTCLVLTWGCSRPTIQPGDDCELNTQCSAPLVCRLGRCRVECRASRDCAPGLECVRDEDSLGACQIRDETDCSLSSDCPSSLVCLFRHCTNACQTDVDCPPGALCEADEAGLLGCRDGANMECTHNSGCPEPYICARDGRCREECREDWDCRDGEICLDGPDPNVCGDPSLRPDGGIDASVPDGGVPDGGVPDGGAFDGGMAMVSPPPFERLASGLAHACVTRAPGDLYCWGDNSQGQLGSGGALAPEMAPAPVMFGTVLDFHVVGGGANHSCAASTTEMRCWGDNTNGQVGNIGAGNPVVTPAMVLGLAGPAMITDIATGSGNTCAIEGGSLYCWGQNSVGQLGSGDRVATSGPSVPVSVGGAVAQVASFGDHTCVRRTDGVALCFGYNRDGESGNGATDGLDVLTATPVVGLGAVSDIATGTTHSCAIETSGQVFCWGRNRLGQLGDGNGGFTSPPSPSAVPVSGIPEPALQLALGSVHACARTATAVYCWGDNFFGQCGSDNTVGSGLNLYTATAVAGLGAVDEIVAGTSHTCVLEGAGVRCFGSDAVGQLGDGTPADGDEWMAMPVMGI